MLCSHWSKLTHYIISIRLHWHNYLTWKQLGTTNINNNRRKHMLMLLYFQAGRRVGGRSTCHLLVRKVCYYARWKKYDKCIQEIFLGLFRVESRPCCQWVWFYVKIFFFALRSSCNLKSVRYDRNSVLGHQNDECQAAKEENSSNNVGILGHFRPSLGQLYLPGAIPSKLCLSCRLISIWWLFYSKLKENSFNALWEIKQNYHFFPFFGLL